MREKEKVIPLNGASYRLRKFPAIDGAYFLKLIIEKLIPAVKVIIAAFPGLSKTLAGEGAAKADKEVSIDEMVATVLPVLSSISKQDLAQIMTDCLNRCDKMLPAGPQPVMHGKEFGVPDLEDDIVTCLILCYRVVEFNVAGFFGEGGSPFSPTTINRIIQFMPKTSTDGRGPQ
jgi:hypothetical protein